MECFCEKDLGCLIVKIKKNIFQILRNKSQAKKPRLCVVDFNLTKQNSHLDTFIFFIVCVRFRTYAYLKTQCMHAVTLYPHSPQTHSHTEIGT